MCNGKVSDTNLHEPIKMLCSFGVYKQVLKLLKFLDVVDQFDDGKKKYEHFDAVV